MGFYRHVLVCLVNSTKVLEGYQKEVHKDFTKSPFGILQNSITILDEFCKEFCEDSARILKGFDCSTKGLHGNTWPPSGSYNDF